MELYEHPDPLELEIYCDWLEEQGKKSPREYLYLHPLLQKYSYNFGEDPEYPVSGYRVFTAKHAQANDSPLLPKEIWDRMDGYLEPRQPGVWKTYSTTKELWENLTLVLNIKGVKS